jgi:putative ABC transport system permease protein
VDRLLADLRHAVRGLARAPGFTLASVLALTLGVGAVTALTAVLWAVLLRPLPYHDPDNLVAILHGDTVSQPVSPADYLDLRQRARTVTDIAAAQAWGANLSADGRAERIPALQVSGTLFNVLGVGPALGRTIVEADTAPGHGHVAVIGHGLWVRRFGEDPATVGREIRLNGEAFTIVGVMPQSFRFAPFWQTQAELWVPLVLDARRTDRSGRSLRLFARLADGRSLATLRSELAMISRDLSRTYPDTDHGLTTGAVPLAEKSSGPARPLVLAVFGLAVAVLLIACANLATLNLARLLSRGRELAVRSALGASWRRLAALLVTEGLMLGALGAAGGALLAWAGLGALTRFLPPGALPPHATLELSVPMLVFSLAVGVASSLTATLVPLAHVGDRALADAVRDGRALAGSRSSRRTRSALVGAEVALALVLLVAAGLLGRTLLALRQVDPGFAPSGVVSLSASLQGTTSADPQSQARFFTEVVARVAEVPGVSAAAAINHLPLAGDLWSFGYQVEARPAPPIGQEPHAAYRVISPGYFRALGQPRLHGRDFESGDLPDGPPVAIVNDTFARKWWPDGGAVGHRVRFAPRREGDVARTIVGVVADARQRGLTVPPFDEIYVPLAQRPEDDYGRSSMTVVARGTGSPGALLAAVRDIVRTQNRGAAVYDEATLDQVLAREMWRERLASDLVGAFAAIALLLAVLGIHGIVSHAVAGRVREFGVRLALGATPASLPRLAMRDAVAPLGTGLALGLALALVVGRLMTTLLVEVAPSDPWVLGGTMAALSAAAAIAAWWPAARIARLDPSSALRSE